MNEAIHTNCSRQHRFTGPQCHSPSFSDRQGHQLTSDAPGLTGAHHVAETNKTSKYVGHNYTTPDLVAKVTGKAKYAEDYRADGMLFAKLLLSPMPHARVTRIDASK